VIDRICKNPLLIRDGNMDVSILIISFNTRELTLACLKSVYAQTRDVAFEVIVVDNASSDDSADAIAAAFPQVRLVRMSNNRGFAMGNNVAADMASGNLLLLLNSDTELLDGTVQRAVAFFRGRNQPSIVGGRTFFADGSLNANSCHGKPTPWSLFCMGFGLSCLFRGSALFDPESLGPWKRDTVRQVDAITGCFLLIDRILWNELDGFDQHFFMYGEDTDLCLRARQRGVACIICPDARLIHLGGRSERTRAAKMVKLFRAKVRLFNRWWNPRWVRFGYRMLVLWALTRSCAYYLLGLFTPSYRETARVWSSIFKSRDQYDPIALCMPPSLPDVVPSNCR
jgi:N-acetylglucosaminyl-diphospho-decaprenol L-rhamnosyltransferase